MEWIEVFVATSQMGLEPVEGVLYQCGLNGLMIHDEADFAEFLENPNREGTMLPMNWWKKNRNRPQASPFSCVTTSTAENSCPRSKAHFRA